MSTLVQIWIRPATRTPLKPVAEAVAEEGTGLVGDHAGGGKRQVTLISREAWQAACRDLDAELDPVLRRANLLVEGVDFVQSRGRQLRVGEVLLEVAGETKPCQLMDDMHLGLWDALKPDWRGGVFARVLEGGTLRQGDALEWV